MSRIFISGSSTGLGLMAGELLSSQGHQSSFMPAMRPAPRMPGAPYPRPRRS